MVCPYHKKQYLIKAIFYNIEIDYCPICLGLWFDQDELRLAKDNKDGDLRWFDIDLWKDNKKFKIARGIRFCPPCRVPLYEVYYGDSGVIIDVCNLCHGIWLDRKEFKKIMDWTKEKANYKILHNYLGNLSKQALEIFTGPETMREEVLDFLTILKLLNYKFLVQRPFLSKIISQMPK